MASSYSIDGRPPMNIEIDGSDASIVQLDRSRGEDDAFEQGVLSLLRRIAGIATGRVVLNFIHQMTQLRIRIVPTNVSTESVAVRIGNVLGMTFRARAVDELGQVRAGGAGSAADEILLHELVHCVRHMKTWADQSLYNFTGMGDGFHNIEEFYAVLIANMYSSETGRPLRRDHSLSRDGTTVPLVRTGSIAGLPYPVFTELGLFYPRHRNEVELMRDESFGFGVRFSDQLAGIECGFNTLRQMARDQLQTRCTEQTFFALRGHNNQNPPSGRSFGVSAVSPRRGRH